MADTTTALSLSDRFTNKVIGAYQDIAKGIKITDRERSLIANYFIGIDKALKESKKGYHWGMVLMDDLAIAVAHKARLGLDMGIENMISFIPFKKGETGKISLVPVTGYKGYEYLAKTYGLTPPKNFVVELVYTTDTFREIKKDDNHKKDTYIFEVGDSFDRGEIKGGFGYLEYEDETCNKILVMSEQQILSYRPQYYDKTFWTGENQKKMYKKTIAKQLLKTVTLDPEKVNAVKNSWERIEAEEIALTSNFAAETIADNANTGNVIDISDNWEEAAESEQPVENSVETVDNLAEEQPIQDNLFEVVQQ